MTVTWIYLPAQSPFESKLQFSGEQKAVKTKPEQSCFTEDVGANTSRAGNLDFLKVQHL